MAKNAVLDPCRLGRQVKEIRRLCVRQRASLIHLPDEPAGVWKHLGFSI
jgi:hypothetical protein